MQEPSSWSLLADKKAKEYFARQTEQRRKETEAAMAKMKADLGLSPDQSLWEYVRLFEPGTAQVPTDEGDDVIANAIERFFEKIERVYVDGEAWEKHFPAEKRGGD